MVPPDASDTGELEVIVRVPRAQHHAVEPRVIFEPPDLVEAEPAAVHRHGSLEVADGTGDAEIVRHRCSVLRRLPRRAVSDPAWPRSRTTTAPPRSVLWISATASVCSSNSAIRLSGAGESTRAR